MSQPLYGVSVEKFSHLLPLPNPYQFVAPLRVMHCPLWTQMKNKSWSFLNEVTTPYCVPGPVRQLTDEALTILQTPAARLVTRSLAASRGVTSVVSAIGLALRPRGAREAKRRVASFMMNRTK